MVRLLKNPYVIFPALIAMILATSFYIYTFPSPKSLDLSDAVYFTEKPLPEAVLINVKTKKDEYESLRKGKILVVFLTTSCNACKKDVNLISPLYSDLNSDIKIYGVAGESENKVKQFIEQNDIKFPVVIDKQGRLLKNLSVKYFPTKFLIEDGIIVKTVIGNSPDKDKFLKDFNLGEIQ